MLSPVVKRKDWYWKREDWSHTLGLNGTWAHLLHEYIKTNLDHIRNDFGGEILCWTHPTFSDIVIFYRICKEYDLKVHIPFEYQTLSKCNGRVELYDEMQETGIVHFLSETGNQDEYPYFPAHNIFTTDYQDIIQTIGTHVENLPDNLDNLIIPGNSLLVASIFQGLTQYNKRPKHIVGYAFDYRYHNLLEYAKKKEVTSSVFFYELNQMKLDRYDFRADLGIMVDLDHNLEKRAFIIFNERLNKNLEKNNCFWVTKNFDYLRYLVEWREFDPILYGTDSDLEAAEKAYREDPKKEGVIYGNP